jgi:hypothetical protein
MSVASTIMAGTFCCVLNIHPSKIHSL